VNSRPFNFMSHSAILLGKLDLISFFSPTPSSGPLHPRIQTTKGVGGRSSLGLSDAVGTVRLMPFLPDGASSLLSSWVFRGLRCTTGRARRTARPWGGGIASPLVLEQNLSCHDMWAGLGDAETTMGRRLPVASCYHIAYIDRRCEVQKSRIPCPGQAVDWCRERGMAFGTGK
jgi:hypothetical protein